MSFYDNSQYTGQLRMVYSFHKARKRFVSRTCGIRTAITVYTFSEEMHINRLITFQRSFRNNELYCENTIHDISFCYTIKYCFFKEVC